MKWLLEFNGLCISIALLTCYELLHLIVYDVSRQCRVGEFINIILLVRRNLVAGALRADVAS